MDNSSSGKSYLPLYIGIGVVVFILGVGGAILVVKNRNAAKDQEAIDQTAAEEATQTATTETTHQNSGSSAPKPASGTKVYSNYDKAWDYKKEGGIWYTHKKGATAWISLAGNKVATDKLNSAYPNA